MVDLEKITSEIRAILPDVTPGPWYQTSEPWFSSGDGVLAGSPDGNVAYLIADCDDFALPRDEYDGPFQLGDRDRDAAYIALCSPDNIGALLAERAADRATIASLRSKLEEAEGALEPFAFGDSDIADILWGNLPDDASMKTTAPLGAYRRARRTLASLREADHA